jgi:ubiquinone/menaquinone biosynthesis C-methylase UbiE
MTAPTSPFDRIATSYRNLWDESDAGGLQRNAVRRCMEPLVRAGDRILDLGCGTGEDALRLADLGAVVTGIDASPEMVRIARSRGVDATVCRIENVTGPAASFEGAVSNFGALNCVRDLPALRAPLARLIAPGGYLVICVMGRFCLWETVWYLVRGDIGKAVRRWKGSADSSLGPRVYYPSIGQIAESFSPAFRLDKIAGIGILVPPSFVRGLPRDLTRRFARIDRRIAGWPVSRALGDHRVLIFRRA